MESVRLQAACVGRNEATTAALRQHLLAELPSGGCNERATRILLCALHSKARRAQTGATCEAGVECVMSTDSVAMLRLHTPPALGHKCGQMLG